ncbi:Hypothetical_protein [Hexamita inflata]|uniref:Hypothetical_protein n=1 Tax=Hexamita inflata TaxID=28002 RepID=A0ABP1GFI7_9EUKA
MYCLVDQDQNITVLKTHELCTIIECEEPSFQVTDYTCRTRNNSFQVENTVGKEIREDQVANLIKLTRYELFNVEKHLDHIIDSERRIQKNLQRITGNVKKLTKNFKLSESKKM